MAITWPYYMANFLDCPLYYAQRLSLRNTVTRSSQFRLLYGDDDLDYESNVAIILAVHEFIKVSERFWLCILYVYISWLLNIIDYSIWNSLYMRVSTTWQLWLLDCIRLSQNVWYCTGDTCVCVCVVWTCPWLIIYDSTIVYVVWERASTFFM